MPFGAGKSGWGPLRTRPLEMFYVLWLVFHLVLAIGIDMRPFYPKWLLALFPEYILDIPNDWVARSGDPFLASLLPEWRGRLGRVNEFTWVWANVAVLEA